MAEQESSSGQPTQAYSRFELRYGIGRLGAHIANTLDHLDQFSNDAPLLNTTVSRSSLIREPLKTLFRPLTKTLQEQPTSIPTDGRRDRVIADSSEQLEKLSGFDNVMHSVESFGQTKMTQRTFVKLCAAVGATGLAAGEIATSFDTFQQLEYGFYALKAFLFLHNVHSPEQLIDMSYNHDTPVVLPLWQMARMAIRGIGDSIYEASGIRINRLKEDQPNSFLDFFARIPKHLNLQKLLPGEPNFVWIEKDDAVPGETTDDALGIPNPFLSTDQRLSLIQQLGDTQIDDEMIRDPNHEVQFVGFDGDNWRALIATMKDFSSRIKLMKNQDHPTLEQLKEISKLIDEHEVIKQQFGDGVIAVLDREYTLGRTRNMRRSHLNQRPDQYTYIVTLPYNMRLVDSIPAKAYDDPHPGSTTINTSQILNAGDIFYHIDEAIYTVLAQRLPQWHRQHPDVQLFTLSMMGNERADMMDEKTGHPNWKWHKWFAAKILDRFGVQINGKTYMLRDYLEPSYNQEGENTNN